MWCAGFPQAEFEAPSVIYLERRSAPLAVYPPAMDEQPLNAGILDLATHKACGTEYRYPAR